MSEVKPKYTRDGVPMIEVSFPLFKNDKKETENQPDYRSWDKDRGIGAAAWLKKDKNGNTYMSVTVEYPNNGEGEPSQPPPMQQVSAGSVDLDDDIPF